MLKQKFFSPKKFDWFIISIGKQFMSQTSFLWRENFEILKPKLSQILSLISYGEKDVHSEVVKITGNNNTNLVICGQDEILDFNGKKIIFSSTFLPTYPANSKEIFFSKIKSDEYDDYMRDINDIKRKISKIYKTPNTNQEIIDLCKSYENQFDKSTEIKDLIDEEMIEYDYNYDDLKKKLIDLFDLQYYPEYQIQSFYKKIIKSENDIDSRILSHSEPLMLYYLENISSFQDFFIVSTYDACVDCEDLIIKFFESKTYQKVFYFSRLEYKDRRQNYQLDININATNHTFFQAHE